VALCPAEAAFAIDPHEDGVYAEWYEADCDDSGWKRILTTRPFYRQGYEDLQGHQYIGNMWYRIKVDVPESAAAKKLILCIPTLTTEAWCWVNGQYIGHRKYKEAYTRPSDLEMEVTEAIRPGATNVIALRVSTSLSPAQTAEGLQSRAFLYSPR
jgi:beta-galactosidase/beta-glucuronidase